MVDWSLIHQLCLSSSEYLQTVDHKNIAVGRCEELWRCLSSHQAKEIFHASAKTSGWKLWKAMDGKHRMEISRWKVVKSAGSVINDMLKSLAVAFCDQSKQCKARMSMEQTEQTEEVGFSPLCLP